MTVASIYAAASSLAYQLFAEQQVMSFRSLAPTSAGAGRRRCNRFFSFEAFGRSYAAQAQALEIRPIIAGVGDRLGLDSFRERDHLMLFIPDLRR
jgi:hypothetical protein